MIMQKGNPSNAQADAGHHYVLLVRPGTLQTVAVQEANATNGAYQFNFTNVSPGDYILVAGTDSDGDTKICDPGEACGAFPTTESAEAITVDSDRAGLQFVTGFAVDVGAAAASAAAERTGYSIEVGGTPDTP
ncbi:MAG: hypothetical protein E6J87_01705 [Deltaproteobacteria bacterium]|nr:MAG: hypothetical protein E6J87_01705 [Deltaproteobacteria bacterium]